MRFLFFSLFFASICLISCKNESKLERLDLEQLTIKEQDSVRKLLELSKSFLQREQYDDAVENLTIIINNFGTYPEFLEAKELIDEAKNGSDLKTIAESNDLNELAGIKNKSISPEVRNSADFKMKDVINNSDNIDQLENYLGESGFKKYEQEAKNRLNTLKENAQESAYNDAVAAKSAKQWKDYLESYPDDPRRSDIEIDIIKLEVNEIFAGDYGEIPSFNRTSGTSSEISSVTVKNDTRYTLTLRYSGNDVKRIVIPAGNSKEVDLKSGPYRVTASVDAYNVRNYAGTETLNGEYDVVYYISND